MKFTLAASLMTAASLLTAGAAAAQAYGAPPRPRIACAADIQRLCSSAQPGKPAMRCLRREAGQASPQCQASLQAARAMRAERRSQQGAGYQQGGPQQGPGYQQGGPQQGEMAPQDGGMPPQ